MVGRYILKGMPEKEPKPDPIALKQQEKMRSDAVAREPLTKRIREVVPTILDANVLAPWQAIFERNPLYREGGDLKNPLTPEGEELLGLIRKQEKLINEQKQSEISKTEAHRDPRITKPTVKEWERDQVSQGYEPKKKE